MRISLVLSLFVLSSCYSPKTDIEEDKYPEIPGFPNFSDKTIILEKVLDLPLSQKDNCTFLIKDSYLLVYNFPVTDSYQNNTNRLFIINQGKLTIFEKWKTNPAINNLAFTDTAGNLYANNRRYLAPDFRYKQILPFFDLNDIQKKYESLFHKGESEKDSVLMRKIADEQMMYQKNILEKGNQILMVTDGMNPEILDRSAYTGSYLFNPGQKNAYFVSHNLLQELKTKDSAVEKDPLYIKLQPKIKLAQKENIFYPDIQKEYIDSVSFKIKDKIVSGNRWFSTGNHFVGSFGYNPIYLYYYDVKIGNKTVFTKEDHTQIVVSDPIKTKTGKYFLVSNIKEGKFQIYYLKN